jgi:hypothetical protein
MANTYNPLNVGSVVLDYARFRIADTASPWLFADEEINATIASASDLRAGLVLLAQSAYLIISKKADFMVLGDERKGWEERALAYKTLMGRLADDPLPPGIGGSGLSTQIPVSGSISRPDLTEFLTD